eukprot:scpid89207/ scgid22886/ 
MSDMPSELHEQFFAELLPGLGSEVPPSAPTSENATAPDEEANAAPDSEEHADTGSAGKNDLPGDFRLLDCFHDGSFGLPVSRIKHPTLAPNNGTTATDEEAGAAPDSEKHADAPESEEHPPTSMAEELQEDWPANYDWASFCYDQDIDLTLPVIVHSAPAAEEQLAAPLLAHGPSLRQLAAPRDIPGHPLVPLPAPLPGLRAAEELPSEETASARASEAHANAPAAEAHANALAAEDPLDAAVVAEAEAALAAGSPVQMAFRGNFYTTVVGYLVAKGIKYTEDAIKQGVVNKDSVYANNRVEQDLWNAGSTTICVLNAKPPGTARTVMKLSQYHQADHVDRIYARDTLLREMAIHLLVTHPEETCPHIAHLIGPDF